ncbi:MAG: iron-sulfur cluster repair di-iron protein [Bacteroidetes bacterium]|nr:iron-sulfur cluster repair di-iron protein [Bacteroidota bacterium]
MGNRTVGELVAEDYRVALIFKNHGIDFCCGGKRTVERACRDKEISVELIETEIFTIQNQGSAENHKFNEWSPSFLVDYIVNIHHAYVNNNLGLITEFANKVAKVHGDQHPENIRIADIWLEIAAELTTHMKKEELMLFPYIRKMESEGKVPKSVFGTVVNPVSMMEAEHESVGDLMKEIQALSNNYTPPATACNTYRVLYAKLKEFQDDLFQHIHLENNILFPKIVKLEAQFADNQEEVL